MGASRLTIYEDPPATADTQAGGEPVELPVWTTPSYDSKWFDQAGFVAVPANGVANRTNVLSFQMPRSYDGIIKFIANAFLGPGFTDGSGGIVWRLFIDSEAVENYENVLYSLGLLANPSHTHIVLKELQTITVTVETVAPFVVPGGSTTGARIQGWKWPKARSVDA